MLANETVHGSLLLLFDTWPRATEQTFDVCDCADETEQADAEQTEVADADAAAVAAAAAAAAAATADDDAEDDDAVDVAEISCNFFESQNGIKNRSDKWFVTDLGAMMRPNYPL